MKKPFILLAAFVVAICSIEASAQSAMVRSVGLLALNASQLRSGPASAAGGGRVLVEIPDGGGGGSSGSHAGRGSGDAATASQHEVADTVTTPDALPPKMIIAPGDPAASAAPTPKRPSYRWQTLVPGAIK